MNTRGEGGMDAMETRFMSLWGFVQKARHVANL